MENITWFSAHPKNIPNLLVPMKLSIWEREEELITIIPQNSQVTCLQIHIFNNMKVEKITIIYRSIINVNAKCKNIKLLEENRGNLCDLWLGNDFSDMTPKRKYWQIGHHQNQNFCSLKNTVRTMKRQLQCMRKYLQGKYLLKDFIQNA